MNSFLRFVYARGLRPRTLAEESGVPLGTIYAISAGNRRISPETRRRLAQALRCKPSSIPEPAADG